MPGNPGPIGQSGQAGERGFQGEIGSQVKNGMQYRNTCYDAGIYDIQKKIFYINRIIGHNISFTIFRKHEIVCDFKRERKQYLH